MGATGKFHKGLLTRKPHSMGFIKERWENEGNIPIWRLVGCKPSWKCTNSNIWQDLSWKCLMQFFITPQHLSTWTQVRSAVGGYVEHWQRFWDCLKIKPFWLEFHKSLITIFKVYNISFQFFTILLWTSDNLQGLANKYLFTFLREAAKKAGSLLGLPRYHSGKISWMKCDGLYDIFNAA